MLNPIRIVFQSIEKTIDSSSYINQRFGLLLDVYTNQEGDHKLTNSDHQISTLHHTALINLVVNSQFPQPQLATNQHELNMSQNQQLIADERVQCAIQTINNVNPLLPGERLLSQAQSYLEAPYLGYTQRTGVIQQITNMATLYFFFLDCYVDSAGDVTWVPPRDRHQKALYSKAISSLDDDQYKKILSQKLSEGLKRLIPVPYNSLVVTA